MNDNAIVDNFDPYAIMIVIIFLFACCFYGFTLLNPLFTQTHNVNMTVIEKIPYHDGYYLIVANIDGKEEVLSVSDEWILLNFNASDRYAFLKEGKSYWVDICGIRFPFLSMYRNIYNVHEGHFIDNERY